MESFGMEYDKEGWFKKMDEVFNHNDVPFIKEHKYLPPMLVMVFANKKQVEEGLKTSGGGDVRLMLKTVLLKNDDMYEAVKTAAEECLSTGCLPVFTRLSVMCEITNETGDVLGGISQMTVSHDGDFVRHVFVPVTEEGVGTPFEYREVSDKKDLVRHFYDCMADLLNHLKSVN